MADTLIHPEALHQWVHQLWRTAGSSEREAQLTADHLVLANLSGHDSHGVGMIPRYVESWLLNELKLNQHVTVVNDAGTVLTLDGQGGMGQVVAQEAMALGIARAQEQGVCVMGLRWSHHLGRVGHWAEQAVAAGLISVHFVNAVSTPIVAPQGGREGRFVTNPFTVGIPVQGREPIVLDFATSAIAMGKVRVAHLKGAQVPAGALIDASGQPTQNPDVMFPPEGQARGALLPFGGHKGYALAMVCELLGAALTGGPTTRPAHLTAQQAVWNNMLTLLFDPARMSAADVFSSEVAAYVEWVKSAALQPGAQGIQTPGEPERATRLARAQGVPLDAGTLAELDHAAVRTNQAQGSALVALSSLALG
jgi:hydroxycarboxylate dehydrogenase B